MLHSSKTIKSTFFILAFNFMIFIPNMIHAQDDAATLARLNVHLSNIEQTTRMNREIGGGALIGFGVLMGGGLTVAYLAIDSIGDFRYIFLGGSIAAFVILCGGGGLILAFPSEYEVISSNYGKMPESSKDDITRKIVAGEASLDTMNSKARSARLLSAGILAVFGASAIVSSFTIPQPTYGYQYSYLMYEGLADLGVALIQVFIKSYIELEYDSYSAWKSKQPESVTKNKGMSLGVSKNDESFGVYVSFAL
jgi:hypothetical protein